MTEDQKKDYEAYLKKSIEEEFNKEGFGVISLIARAYQSNLFFPEMYETYYEKVVNKSTITGYDNASREFKKFGLDAERAGDLFFDIFLANVSAAWLKNEGKDKSSRNALSQLHTAMEDNDLILPAHWTESSFFNTLGAHPSTVERIDKLKEKNKMNILKFTAEKLDREMPVREIKGNKSKL